MTDMNENINFTIQEIKKDFFCYRNGLIADSLKKLYKPGKMIFGLTVPQFLEMAKKYPKDTNLGISLWQDNSSREARLFSFYLMEPSEIDFNTAKTMIKEVGSNEEAEFLAFKILARMPEAPLLLEESNKENYYSSHSFHCINMLKKNLDRNKII